VRRDRRIKENKHKITEIGVEKICNRCNEWWPADDEFFHQGDSRDGLASWCKACISEYSAERWALGKHKKVMERRAYG